METDLLVFNGVDGTTGRYLRAPLRFDQLAQRFGARVEEGRRPTPVLAPMGGIDSRNLAETGWGVIFAPEVSPAIREALGPLLEHRRAQAARNREVHYRECRYQSETSAETSASFLARHGKGPGPANPAKMPYYLLIVGSPEEIPYSFQYQLDVQYAVGRIWFETVEEYAHYAQSVLAAENQQTPFSRQAAFFAPENPDDPLTRLSARKLVEPLAQSLTGRPEVADWAVSTWLGEEATKARLARVLGGPETPALLFTAGHGVGFWETDPRQRELQGALLCCDWPGPRAETISAEHYFSACDVERDARLHGLVSFHFACYSAGTPRWDSFSHLEAGERRTIARESFMAGLPRKLLGHPRGGALAVIGHIDQVWPCSFLWEETEAQLEVFESTLLQLMQGYPVGAAMEYFGQRYAEIAAELSQRLEPGAGEPGSDPDLAALWLAGNDARSYAVCGDPAVRLISTSS